jgi:hypothetical protein
MIGEAKLLRFTLEELEIIRDDQLAALESFHVGGLGCDNVERCPEDHFDFGASEAHESAANRQSAYEKAEAYLRAYRVKQADCCIKHLVETGRGVIASSGIFVTLPDHCVDGERARCKTCHKVWQHVCDEAEGCSWICITKEKKARRK